VGRIERVGVQKYYGLKYLTMRVFLMALDTVVENHKNSPSGDFYMRDTSLSQYKY